MKKKPLEYREDDCQALSVKGRSVSSVTAIVPAVALEPAYRTLETPRALAEKAFGSPYINLNFEKKVIDSFEIILYASSHKKSFVVSFKLLAQISTFSFDYTCIMIPYSTIDRVQCSVSIILVYSAAIISSVCRRFLCGVWVKMVL